MGMIAGILVGLLMLIALGILLFFVVGRRTGDQDDQEAVYETETEASEELIDSGLRDFGTSVEGADFTEEAGLDGGFGISDTFARNPEESALFF
jgi:hypothetical protein